MRKPAGPFYEKWVEVYWNGNKCGVRVLDDYDDSVPIPCRYDSCLILSGYNIALKYNGKWGVLDHQNHVLCSFVYDRIGKPDYRPSLCMAMKDGRWGLIDNSGSPATGFVYDQIKPFTIETYSREPYNGSMGNHGRYSIWALYNEGKVYPYNDSANMIYPRGFDNIYGLIQCGDPYIVVEDNSKKGLLGKDGTMLTKCEYDDIQQLQSYIDYYKASISFALLKKNNKYGVMGSNKKILLQCEFDKITVVGNCLALKHGAKWGILSQKEIYRIEDEKSNE